jgi:hypothetical protein
LKPRSRSNKVRCFVVDVNLMFIFGLKFCRSRPPALVPPKKDAEEAPQSSITYPYTANVKFTHLPIIFKLFGKYLEILLFSSKESWVKAFPRKSYRNTVIIPHIAPHLRPSSYQKSKSFRPHHDAVRTTSAR